MHWNKISDWKQEFIKLSRFGQWMYANIWRERANKHVSNPNGNQFRMLKLTNYIPSAAKQCALNLKEEKTSSQGCYIHFFCWLFSSWVKKTIQQISMNLIHLLFFTMFLNKSHSDSDREITRVVTSPRFVFHSFNFVRENASFQFENAKIRLCSSFFFFSSFEQSAFPYFFCCCCKYPFCSNKRLRNTKLLCSFWQSKKHEKNGWDWTGYLEGWQGETNRGIEMEVSISIICFVLTLFVCCSSAGQAVPSLLCPCPHSKHITHF